MQRARRKWSFIPHNALHSRGRPCNIDIGAAGGRLDRRPTLWLVVYFANTGPLKRKNINA